MKITCSDVECKNYKNGSCMATALDHTADRICITGRNKVEPEYKQMIRNSRPIDFTKCYKSESN